MRRFSLSLFLPLSLALHTQREEIRRIKSPGSAGRRNGEGGSRRGTRLSRKVRNSRASALQTLSFVVLSAPASSGVSFSFSLYVSRCTLSTSLGRGPRAPPYRLTAATPLPPEGNSCSPHGERRARARGCSVCMCMCILSGTDVIFDLVMASVWKIYGSWIKKNNYVRQGFLLYLSTRTIFILFVSILLAFYLCFTIFLLFFVILFLPRKRRDSTLFIENRKFMSLPFIFVEIWIFNWSKLTEI